MATPTYRVTLDGRAMPDALARALRSIEVDLAIDMADRFAMTFENERARASDSPLLAPGTRVAIELGYESGGPRPRRVIEGEVVALKCIFPRRGPATLRVEGYSKAHRLQRGRHTRAWSGLSASQIAERIAREVGLEPAVDPTAPALESVFQRNQTNLELLNELAARHGYEVFAADGKLFFRRPAADGGRVRTLRRGEDLIGFNPRVRAALVPTSVAVLGPGGVAAVAEGDADMGPAMGGTTTALGVAERLRPARQEIRGVAVRDAAEAKAIAQASLRAATQALVTASAETPGAPDLRPGLVVEIDGVGDVFGGLYYVRRAVHLLTREGFATSLTLARSAIGKVAAPPPHPEAPARPAPPPPEGQLIRARLVDEATARPLADVPYEVIGPDGKRFATGTTDWQGGLEHRVPQGGRYTVRALPREGEPAAGGDAFVIAAVVRGIGGTPLARQAVEVVDPDTKAVVAGPIETDDEGRFTAEVPERKEYEVRLIDDGDAGEGEGGGDAAASPDDAASDDAGEVGDDPERDLALLFVRLLDRAGAPLVGEPVTIEGAGGAFEARTDRDGDIEVHVKPGAYRLTARGRTRAVHTLFASDLEDGDDPYEIVIPG